MKNKIMNKYLFFFICVFGLQQMLVSQIPGTGLSPCSALQLYPQTSCGNTSGAQYAGYYQSENAGGANVTMTGTTTIDPTCTSDNETTQAVEWLSVTATSTSFTITNQTDYGNSPALSAQEPRDFILFSGSCNSLSQIQCFTNVAGGASVSATGLTVGQTYYIMVSQSSSAYAACNTCTEVSTCITSTVPFTPTNNGCSTPFDMTTNVQYTSTNANATADGTSVCQNPPSGSVENNVWYEWCAPANWPAGQTAFLIVNNQVCNSTQGLQLSIYSPTTTCANILAGSATSLVCQNPGSTTNYNYSFAANPNECYLITLDGFAGVSCTYNIMVSGSLCATPILSATAINPVICAGNSTTLSVSCASNCTSISYSWSPATGLSSTTGASVTASPLVTTTYTVTGNIGANCESSQTVTVTVNPTNTVSAASSNPTVCINNPISPVITFTTTGATGIGTPVGLPSGVSASFSGNSITVSGTPTTSGIFNYTIPINGGCGSINAIGSITVNPLNTVSSASSNPILCVNAAISQLITFSTTGATGIGAPIGLPTGVSASFSGNTITISGTPTASGTFNYTIPLSGGCGSLNATGSITVNPSNSVSSASSNPTLCENSAISPSITFSTTGSTGIGTPTGIPAGVSASFSGNLITVSGTPISSGTFNYSIPLTGGCGTIFATGIITVNPLNTVTAASSNPILCVNTALSPSITFTTTGATGIGAATGLPAGVTSSWFGNTITITGTPIASGSFNYSIPLTGGCGTVNAAGTITVIALPVITLTPDDPNTCNATDGSILVSGSGNGTITWAGPTSGNSSSSLNYTIPNLGAGTYSVYFTNASGCQSSTLQTSLANPGAPQINIISDVTNCGTSYTLPTVPFVPGTQNNPQYYTGPNGTGSIVAVGTTYNAPTNITLYAYDVNGACSDEEPFTVTINEIPSLNPLTSISGCPGSSIDPSDFSSTPVGATFSWTNDNISVGIPSLGNGQITTYNAPANTSNTNLVGTVSVTPTLNGCSGLSASFSITILPTPTINPISNVSGCPSSSADPADFVSIPSGANFAWTNSNVGIGLTASGNGQISPFNLGTNTTAGVITGTISATATLNGCTSIPLNFSISINPIPMVTLTPTDPSSCNGTNGSVLVNTGAPGSVSWTGTSSGTSGPMNANYTIINLASGSYDVTFTNSSTGCQSSVVSTNLLNPGSPIINPIADVTQCGGSFTLPAITGTSLINAQYYTQPNGGGGIISEGTLFEPDTIITMYAYDVNGACSVTEPFTISLTSIPVITNPGAQSVCDSYSLGTFSGTNIFSPTYWTQTGGQGTQLNIGDVISTSSTVYIYDQNGACTSEESFDITIIPTPSISNPGNQSACATYVLPIITGTNLSGSQEYFNNSQALGGTSITSAITSSQTVYIFDANGACSDEESFQVTINSLPTASISGGATYCQGDAITDISASVTGTPNFTLNYTLDGVAQTQSGTSTSFTLGSDAGIYVLVAISDANCTNSNLSSTQTIVINAIPNSPIAGTDTLYCTNATPIDLLAQGSGSFTWYSDQTLSNILGTNATLVPAMNLGTTNYYVTETINGCEGPASIIVINVEECGIIIPTAFTPDGDQTNDSWTLQNIDQIYPKNIVSIYNRWGNLIYQSNAGNYESQPWDGKYNDEELPVGSYYFIIEYNDDYTSGKSGIVSILK